MTETKASKPVAVSADDFMRNSINRLNAQIAALNGIYYPDTSIWFRLHSPLKKPQCDEVRRPAPSFWFNRLIRLPGRLGRLIFG